MKNTKIVILIWLILSIMAQPLIVSTSSTGHQSTNIKNESKREEGITLENITESVPTEQQQRNLELGLPRFLANFTLLTLNPHEIVSEFENTNYKTFKLRIGEIFLSFLCYVKKPDMGNIFLVDDTGNETLASFDQVYIVESKEVDKINATFVFSTTVISGTFTLNDEIYQLAALPGQNAPEKIITYALYKLNDIIYDDDSAYRQNSLRTYSNTNHNQSKLGIQTHSIQKNPNAITPSTSSTVNYLRGASYSFYNVWGTSTITKLSELWDGGGSEDAYSSLSDATSASFNLVGTKIFTSSGSGPSGTNCTTFLNVWVDYTPLFDPDLAWIVTRDDFIGAHGCSAAGSLGGEFYGVVAIDAPGTIYRRNRHTLAHESAHVFLPFELEFDDTFEDGYMAHAWTEYESYISLTETGGELDGYYNGGGTGWVRSYWEKEVDIVDPQGITHISFDYSFNFKNKMGEIGIYGFDPNGYRTFIVEMSDAWTGNNAKPYIFAYYSGTNIYSWSGTYSMLEYGSGDITIQFIDLDSIKITFYYPYSRSSPEIIQINGVGVTTKIQLFNSAHSDYYVNTEDWSFDNYDEDSPVYNAHGYASYTYYYCYPMGRYRLSIMWLSYLDSTSCYLGQKVYFWFSNYNELHLEDLFYKL